jgi:FlaA1/EpsC-like NDP-sugar epimerase
MGASKKLMEELIMAYANKLPIKTARFANVAFSNGSLPLGFLERLNKNQPWSCPRGIRRFFVSPQESGELCLMASIMGESGDIFFPKLDEDRDMIPFDEIALDLLKTLGLTPDICQSEEEARLKMMLRQAQQPFLDDNTTTRQHKISPSHPLALSPSSSWPIYFFGSDTSGEKSFEEFFTEKEELDNDSFINLGVVKNSKKRSIQEIDSIFDQLHNLFESKEITKAAIIDILKVYLPNFEHIETGKGLDSKM